MLQSNLQVQTKNILNSNHFHSIRRLGKGGFGHVLLATKATSSSTFYAVKCISKKKMIKDPLLKKFVFQQINTMASLDHENIVKLHKTFQQGDWYFLVMEYCDMGSLYNFQSKLNNKVFTKEQSINIFNQILRGVEFIHKNNIIHRDLKMENIFLKKNSKSGNYICKIGDFGLARQLEGTAITNCGTQTYMAPEILSSMKYDKQVDIWALGVLFYYLFCGDFPFKGINILNDIQIKCQQGFNLMQCLQKNKVQINFKSKKQEVIWADFFQRVFIVDPTNRITLSQLKNHPVLKKQDENHYSSGNIILEQVTTNDQQIDEIMVDWQIKRVKYLQEIMRTIKEQNFLSQFLLSAFNFYMNKVLLYFLNKEEIKNFRKDEDANSKILLTIKSLQKGIYESMQREYEKIKNLMNNGSFNNKQTIQKFQEGLNLKFQDFTCFKMGYRNTVGKIYEEVHKKFSDSSYERAVLKLKVFICHIVNRVFSGAKVNENLWPHFFAWVKKNKINYSTRYYDFILLEEWMKNEKVQNLQKSQQIINQMFYK